MTRYFREFSDVESHAALFFPEHIFVFVFQSRASRNAVNGAAMTLAGLRESRLSGENQCLHRRHLSGSTAIDDSQIFVIVTSAISCSNYEWCADHADMYARM